MSIFLNTIFSVGTDSYKEVFKKHKACNSDQSGFDTVMTDEYYNQHKLWVKAIVLVWLSILYFCCRCQRGCSDDE